MGYAKLFSSITESSLWSESKEARLLFVSMLARADAEGFVEAAVPGLARIANLTIDEVQSALTVLESPDKFSKQRHEDDDGRRLVRLLNGWKIVNYAYYRNRRQEEERREYQREYRAKYRSEGRDKSRHRSTLVNNGQHGQPQSTQADGDGDVEAEADIRSVTEEDFSKKSQRAIAVEARLPSYQDAARSCLTPERLDRINMVLALKQKPDTGDRKMVYRWVAWWFGAGQPAEVLAEMINAASKKRNPFGYFRGTIENKIVGK